MKKTNLNRLEYEAPSMEIYKVKTYSILTTSITKITYSSSDEEKEDDDDDDDVEGLGTTVTWSWN